jgi:hypothetical protein
MRGTERQQVTMFSLMSAAGFVACRRLDDVLYQPVLVGRTAS